MEMDEFSDTVYVASAVTEASDTPTNKLGSDTDTTSTSLVVAEGGESSSPRSVGNENSDTTPDIEMVTESETIDVYDTDVNNTTIIVTEASDDTPTNKMGSDSDTTSTCVVIAEGVESSSTISVGMENSETTPSDTVNDMGYDSNLPSGSKKRPTKYMTKKRQLEAKKKVQEDKKLAYKQACEQYNQGKFKSIFAASKHFGLSYTCLYRYLVNGDSFAGKGRKSNTLTEEEELKIVNHVIYRQKIGCGMTYLQLQLIIQEVLIAVTTSNPDRTSPYAELGHFPNRDFARALADRHNLTLRATMEISKGRQILGIDDLVSWQKDTEAGLINLDAFKDCFKDGTRIYNQDETSVQVPSMHYFVK